ncbi:hypothetical protein [Curtobacterium sp. MCLR17_043]|uniref:hypothetical protein n=1 Tax=Curtobacterium sp. MCLR17_043 TaxID=2175627 RepID=UPI0015E8B121|nr:hypothetical protein [Curtobacterium sp. MCLR17_043]
MSETYPMPCVVSRSSSAAPALAADAWLVGFAATFHRPYRCPDLPLGLADARRVRHDE